MTPKKEIPKRKIIPKMNYGDTWRMGLKSVFTPAELEYQKTLPLWLVESLNIKYGRAWMDDCQ